MVLTVLSSAGARVPLPEAYRVYQHITRRFNSQEQRPRASYRPIQKQHKANQDPAVAESKRKTGVDSGVSLEGRLQRLKEAGFEEYPRTEGITKTIATFTQTWMHALAAGETATSATTETGTQRC